MAASLNNEETKRRLPGALSWLQSQLGCSWSEIARQIDIDYADLCKVRRGERLPTLHQGLRLWHLAYTADLSAGFLERVLEGLG